MKTARGSLQTLLLAALVVFQRTSASSVVEVEIEPGIMSATESQTPPSSFPKLSGMNGEEAKAILEKDHPSLSVHLVPEDSMVTMDYREDRVRIFVGKDGKVARVPILG